MRLNKYATTGFNPDTSGLSPGIAVTV